MPDEAARLRRWRLVTVATLFTGYAGYYVCRSVLPVASNAMMNDPASGIDEIAYGRLVAVGIYLYALGKLVNGVAAEYVSGRLAFLLDGAVGGAGRGIRVCRRGGRDARHLGRGTGSCSRWGGWGW